MFFFTKSDFLHHIIPINLNDVTYVCFTDTLKLFLLFYYYYFTDLVKVQNNFTLECSNIS